MRRTIKGSVEGLSRKREKCVRDALEGEKIEGGVKRALIVMFAIQEYYYLKGQVFPDAKVANAYNALAKGLQEIKLEELKRSFGVKKANKKLQQIDDNFNDPAYGVKEGEGKEKPDESGGNDPIINFAEKCEKTCENRMKDALKGIRGNLGDFGEDLLARARGLCAYYAVMEMYEEDAKKKERRGEMKKHFKDISMMMYGDNFKIGMAEAMHKMEKIDSEVFDKIILGIKAG